MIGGTRNVVAGAAAQAVATRRPIGSRPARLTIGAALALLGALATDELSAQSANDSIQIIPRPIRTERLAGAFVLSDPVRITIDSPSTRLAEIADFLAGVIRTRTGFDVTVGSGTDGRPAIVLDERARAAGPEAYQLIVEPGIVHIRAGSASGVFWGVQTLRQLFPPDFENASGARHDTWRIPAVQIDDEPRFRWRGSLMDVARHFFPIEFVERYIDLLSRYKMNVLHWHLTDDQGWRVEIRRYPKLTEIGAWRQEAGGSRYGGFYTQDEVRRVVEYARRRNVTIVPEIEMPGHSQAAIAAYPDLGCTGESVPVATTWGVKKEILCAGNDRTLRFVEGVLDEVLAMFPSEYIHIGGDEVPKDRWRECASCQTVMKREGLSDEDELQSWFIARIHAYLRARGRKLIGWDEILEGGLPPGATVQVWRDMAHATRTVRLGSPVIASPTSHAYFDGSPRTLPIERVYQFDPVPPGLAPHEASRVLGGEANLWSEFITPANFDLMAFPRLLAMAEVLWSAGPREYDEFLRRLRGGHYPRLRALGVRVGPEDRDVVRLTTLYDSTSRSARVQVERGLDAIAVRYTRDGSAPSARSPLHEDSVTFRAPGTVVLRPFVDGQPFPIERTLTIVNHLARDATVTITPTSSRRYPGTGRWTLVDGLLGSSDLHDGLWQGWLGTDLEAVVDLGAPRTVRTVTASFLHAMPSWVMLPASVTCALSDDGRRWRPAGSASHGISPRKEDPLRVALECRPDRPSRARYVKIVARGFGALPSWHPGAGRPSWMFADEIIVR